ncbi:MAG: dihydroorotase [Betaproteobacteria bacterium]|nr:dihydroorotase [Betaproteobacteria bacterium]
MRTSILHGRVLAPSNRSDLKQSEGSIGPMGERARSADEDTQIGFLADVHLADGRVIAIGNDPADLPEGWVADRVIDARDMIVAPGLVDLAARLREPGFEYRATLESEMQAAVVGGITALVCPPDTDPPLDEPGLVEMLKYRARSLAGAHLYPLGALTVGLQGTVITEMAELAEAGCVGFSQASVPMVDTQVLLRALQYAKTFGFPVWLQPQDSFLARGGIVHAGPLASRMGLPGIPVIAETVALQTMLELVRVTGARVHFCRLSSAAGIALMRAAKLEGLPVTCDVSVHHLHVTDQDIGWFDANHRVDPPFRSQRDRDAIRAGLADGTVDAICSDHTPVDDDAKALPYGEAEPGTTGLELLLPLVLKWAQESRTPLAQALATVTSGPAAIVGADRMEGAGAGTLAPGSIADLMIFDPQALWTVDRNSLVSQGRHTPFLGYEIAGRVMMTLVAGVPIFQRS